MSSGIRHVLGLMVGVVLTPVIAAGLVFGVDRANRHSGRFAATFREGITGAGLVAILVFAAVAVLIAILVASRISPVAALVPGVVFTAYGVLWTVKSGWVYDIINWLPEDATYAAVNFSAFDIPVLVGAILLAASLFPSRWRSVPTASLFPPRTAVGPTAGTPPPGWQPPPRQDQWGVEPTIPYGLGDRGNPGGGPGWARPDR